MKRVALVTLALALALVGAAGCSSKVSVQTGQRLMCSYGHEISNTVHTQVVDARDASNYTVTTTQTVCTLHQRLAKTYAQAQAALKTGNTKLARAKLELVVAGDKTFGKAASQLDEIKSGRTPAPDETSPKTADKGGSSGNKPKPPTPGGDTPVGPVTTLESWVPATLVGYKTGVTTPDPMSISREYLPETKGDLEAVVLAAEQFATHQAALAELKAEMAHYAKDTAQTKVAGRPTTSGHDGRQFAALGFVDGSVLVIAEGHAAEGAAPKSLLGELQKIVAGLPAK